MYNIEVKASSKNGWFTPAEAKAYYGRYSRDGICCHWWGDGTGANNHDNIVNYFLNQSQAGVKSVNYVVSDNKITLMVNPDNVAWASQSGNPTTVSIEFQPTLNPEGYKKGGWLINELRGRYGHNMPLSPHKQWFPTDCPGTISLDLLEQEAQRWASGGYNPAPPVDEWKANQKTVNKKLYTLANAKLVDVNTMAVVKAFPLDTPMDIGAETSVGGRQYWQTVYARDNGRSQGFLKADLKDSPTPPPEPVTEPPVQPEWVLNLRDIDDTKYWLIEDTALIDITTGDNTATILKKDNEFVASALTSVRGVEYRITDYSFKKGIYKGIPINKLTLTAPNTPVVPPVPDYQKQIDDLKTENAGLKAKLQQLLDYIKNLFNN